MMRWPWTKQHRVKAGHCLCERGYSCSITCPCGHSHMSGVCVRDGCPNMARLQHPDDGNQNPTADATEGPGELVAAIQPLMAKLNQHPDVWQLYNEMMAVEKALDKATEGPGDVPEQQEEWNLHTHLGRAYLLIAEVKAKIGAGNLSDDLDLAQAHINTVMVAGSKSPISPPALQPPALQQTGVEGERDESEMSYLELRQVYQDKLIEIEGTLHYLAHLERAGFLQPPANSLTQSRPACEHQPYYPNGFNPRLHCRNCGYRLVEGLVAVPTDILLPQPEGGE